MEKEDADALIVEALRREIEEKNNTLREYRQIGGNGEGVSVLNKV